MTRLLPSLTSPHRPPRELRSAARLRGWRRRWPVANDSRLVEVASAVAEGSAVNWTSVEQSAADDAERAAMRELQVVAHIAEALRAPHVTPCSVTPDPAAHVRVGDLWGHLRISELIGEGSFGSVYRAWDTRLECEVALKLIKG